MYIQSKQLAFTMVSILDRVEQCWYERKVILWLYVCAPTVR